MNVVLTTCEEMILKSVHPTTRAAHEATCRLQFRKVPDNKEIVDCDVNHTTRGFSRKLQATTFIVVYLSNRQYFISFFRSLYLKQIMLTFLPTDSKNFDG